MNVQILYAFSFPGGLLFEIKFQDVPETAPKSERYHWYIYQRELIPLIFDRIEGEVRYFKDDTVADLEHNLLYYQHYQFPLITSTEDERKRIRNLI